ncbi:MAG: hypothetical protein ACK5WZ_02890 [Pseudobdellovibrionaceae bacterium]
MHSEYKSLLILLVVAFNNNSNASNQVAALAKINTQNSMALANIVFVLKNHPTFRKLNFEYQIQVDSLTINAPAEKSISEFNSLLKFLESKFKIEEIDTEYITLGAQDDAM